MPEMTGVEFLEQLRTFDSTTPFIFISAYGHQQQTLLKSNLNISDFLVKPVREPAFLKTVRKFLKLDPALDLPLVK
jgi:two-component SAPR family response regulator